MRSTQNVIGKCVSLKILFWVQCLTETIVLATMGSNGGNDDNTMMSAAKETTRVPFRQN